MGLQLQARAKGQAVAVPPGGPRWQRELHLFIIAIYIVSGICRRLQQPHSLIRPRRALGAAACQEDSGVDPGLESLVHPPELTAGPGSLSPLASTQTQPGPHSLLPEQPGLPSVPGRTFQQLE